MVSDAFAEFCSAYSASVAIVFAIAARDLEVEFCPL